MPEQSYPISCKSCGKQLYGSVFYCPYCAAPYVVAPAKETVEEPATIEQVTDDTVTSQPEIVSVQQPPPVQVEVLHGSPPEEIRKVAPKVKTTDQQSEPTPEKKTEKPNDEPVVPPVPPIKWKLIAIAVVLVIGLVGYLIFQKKGSSSQESTGSQQSTFPATAAQGKKESARIVAQDALRQGTGLSLTITKLPKLEMVLKAAKQLGDISPRYQEQIASAESTINASRTDRDKSLMVYIGKLVELGRYTPEQVEYSLDVIQSGDISPREKIVVDLLAKHVNSLRSNSKADAKKMLSDFNKKFSDFVD